MQGNYVRLEPLNMLHLSGLVKAASEDRSLYQWTYVPQDFSGMIKYIEDAVKGQAKGLFLPYAIIDQQNGEVKGSTRYWNMQHWAWPEGHERFGRQQPDVCEIGHTWLAASAIRTPINTEAKLLLLTNAFENWGALRVCFQTDVRNDKSRTAIERIGGKFEGIARAERLAVDLTIRDTARFSIIASEWEEVKSRLIAKLTANGAR